MVSKRDLGVSYLLGTGLGLIVSLSGYVVLVGSAADFATAGTISAFGLAGSLPFLGLWLRGSDLSDSAVWAVAKWCAVGIFVPTIVAGGLTLLGIHPQIVLEFPHLLVNLVAAGGVIGAGMGLIRELRRQQARAEALNHRNQMLNNIMRHDIRNDVTVIKGYVDLIGDHVEADVQTFLQPIENKSEQIIETSRIARQVQSLQDEDREPVDLVPLVTGYVEEARETYPMATFEIDLPETAWVVAGDLFGTVLDNLVENAIEHADTAPTVTIAVADSGSDGYTLRVSDDGPGIPATTREVLASDEEQPDDSGAGLGLWLVKWVVERYDGDLTFQDRTPTGTTVEVRLPAATAPKVGTGTPSQSGSLAP